VEKDFPTLEEMLAGPKENDGPLKNLLEEMHTVRKQSNDFFGELIEEEIQKKKMKHKKAKLSEI